MGLRFRKGIKLGGGAKLNLSKSGLGFSFGTKGARYTKKANGGTRQTISVPGTGVSYVKDSSNKPLKQVRTEYPQSGESNIIQSVESQKPKKKSGLRWVFTVLVGICALSAFMVGGIVSGLLFLLLAFIISPFRKRLFTGLPNLFQRKGVLVTVGVIAGFAALFTLPGTTDTDTTPQSTKIEIESEVQDDVRSMPENNQNSGTNDNDLGSDNAVIVTNSEKETEEAEAKSREEEAAKKEEEEVAQKKAEEEAAKKKEEEEAARKAEEEAAKKKAEEEAARKAEEEAAQKKAEEEAARKKAEEEVAQKKAEEEAAKKKAEEEAARKAEEEAAQKKAEEEAAQRAAEEAEAQKAAEEAAQQANRSTVANGTESANALAVLQMGPTTGNQCWVPRNGGTKYHTKADCSGMEDPIHTTEDTAAACGFGPCQRCH